MNGWTISTEACAASERSEFWRNALAKLYLPVPLSIQDNMGFHGDVTSIITPQGIEFSRITGGPHDIEGRCLNQPYSVWMAVLRKGQFTLQQQHRQLQVASGDIIFGPTGVDAKLALQSDFEMLYVKIPRGLVHPRLLNPSTLELGYLPSTTGIHRVFSDMLQSVCDRLDDVDPSTLRPVEIALTEFMVSCLTRKTMVDAFGSTAKLLHYQRICQDIDARLNNPELSLSDVAQSQNESHRLPWRLNS